MKLDEETREMVRAFSRAANRAVEEDPEAQLALETLRASGIDCTLRVRLTREADSAASDDSSSEGPAFTDSDLKELGRMSIRVE